MIRFAYKDKVLMDFLKVEIKDKNLFDQIPPNAILLNETQYAVKKKDNKDKGQRDVCHCIVSKDIGEYDTCPHLCEYCYANTSKSIAVRNYNLAKQTNWTKETITGK